MKKNYIFSAFISLLFLVTPFLSNAQCGTGQTSLDIVIDMTNDFFPDENGWKIVNTNTGAAVDSACFTVYSTGGIQTVTVCLDTGITYSLYALDDFGDGLDGTEYRLAFTYGAVIDTIGANNFNFAYSHCTPVYTNNEIADSSSFFVPYIAPPSCLVPDSLSASNFTTTSADLDWNENNLAIQWEIQYDSTGFTIGNGNDTIVNARPFNLGGLTPSTTYDFYVRSICVVGDTSAWSLVGNFSTSFTCPIGAVCETYNSGAISSDRAFVALPGTSTCPGLMSVIIPAGNRLDSITTRYIMTAYQAPNNAWMSEQRTWLYSPTTLNGEAAMSLGAGTTAGTLSYERTGLTFPKNATGIVEFELHAGRTFGGTACDTVTNSIDNGSWEIIAYYSTIPSCPEPIALTIGNLSQTTAELTWTETGTATQWEVEYGLENFVFGSGTRSILNSNPGQINGLTSSSAYDYYVRSICTPGDSSFWEGPFTFSTAYPIPYFQDFENFGTNTSGLINLEGWNTQGTPTPHWETGILTTSTLTGPAADHTIGTGGIFAYLECSGGGPGDTDTLRSPLIYIDSMRRSVEVSYWYHMYGADMGSLEVYADTNGTLNFINSFFGQQQVNQGQEWFQLSSYLHGYAGKAVTLVFVGTRGGSFNSDVSIDDVAIDTLIPLDIAMSSIVSPDGNLCPGNLIATVAIENKGLDTIVSFDISMDINGVVTTQTVNRSIATGDTIHVDFAPTSISAGLFYDLAFYVDNPNGQVDSIPANDSLFIDSLTTGLSGTITIDASVAISATNFQTFSALANQLNAVGVCGNVTVDVAAATYGDVFFLSNVPGLGDSSRLTIDGGDSNLVFLENNLVANRAIVSFNDVSYVTLKNMTLRNNYNGTLVHFGIHFSNNSNYDSIVNCRILMNPTNITGANGIGASADITNALSQGNNANFVTVMNCAIDGGEFSMHFEGGPNGSANLGNHLINNTLTNMDEYGIYTNLQDSMRIIGNSVRGLRSVNGDGIICIDHMNFEIEENNIIAQDIGIGITNANSFDDPNREATLINNMVIANARHGVYISSPSRLNIYHNTVYNEGAFSAMRLDGIIIIDSLDMRNNVLYSLTDLAFEFGGNNDSLAFLKFDNNVYYTAGTGDLLDIDGTSYADLAAYQTARPAFNISSLEGDPQFVSTTDLHVVGSLINESGDNGANILIDIDGDTRPSPLAIFVDAGADEYTPPPCPTPTNVQALNPGLDSVTVSLIGTSFDYEYEIITRGGPQGTGNIGITTTNSERIGGLTSSTSYDLYVRQVCRRGDTSPWIGPVFFSTSYGVPYLQDFENFATDNEQNPWPEGWLSTTTADPNWISYNPATGTVFRSGNTGPSVDHTVGTNAGTFIFMETSGGLVGDSADYISPPIFIDDTLSTVELKYWYFNFGANIDRMEVIVDTNGVENIVASYTGQQQTSQVDQWLEGKHLLTGYQGKSIQIKFRGFNVACCTGDLAIDDIEIVVPSPINGGVTSILRPTSGCGLGNSDSVEVEIINSGIDTLSNFSLSYALNGATSITETFNGSILSGDTAYYIFNSTVNLATPGNYTLVSYTSIAGDSDLSNDTSKVIIENIPIVSGFPYTESFENGNGGWTSGGDNSTWDLGVPGNTIINSASDGTEAWVTNLTGNYVNNEDAWVQSPCLDFTTLTVPTLEIDVWWNTEFSWDGAVLQSSIDGGSTWQKVGAFLDTVNWYTDNSILGLNNLEPSQEGWSGRNSTTNGSNGWVTAKHKLDGLAGVSGVILRVVFGSDGSVVDEGFAFDKVFITDSLPKLDASLSALVSPVASTDSCYSATEDVIVTLLNSGNVPLDFTVDSASIQVDVSGAITQSLTFTVNDNSLNGGLALLGGNNIEINVGSISMVIGGTYNLRSIIDIAADTIASNDTLLNSLIINAVSGGTLSGIDSICSGDSTVLSTSGYQGSLQWQELTAGVWTDITSETGPSITTSPVSFSEYRVLACGTAASDTLSITAINFASGPLAIGDTTVVACGSPGTAIATVSSTNSNSTFSWYDSQTGGSIIDTSLATYELNATGDQMSYITATTTVGTPAADTLWVSEIVTTGTVQCESPRSSAIVMVDCITGIVNNTSSEDGLNIYPNPSNGFFNLSIKNSQMTNYNFEVRDLSGKIVYTYDLVINGKYSGNMNLSGLAKGVYFLQIKTVNSTEIQKLIIQ